MSNKTALRIEALIRRLSDGKFHSGEAIAQELSISRTAVWKLIQKIEQWQVEIYSIRGRGYQIPGGLELINEELLQYQLSQHNRLFKQVKVLTSIDSTADFLTREWQRTPGEGRVCIAEHQTAGRGRKGRVWVSPFAANLYFSIGVQLPLGLSALGGLSLAVGICLCRVINQFSGDKVKLKWPNDLLVDNKKLAGVLVEASGDTNDKSFLNIGVGINWDMKPKQGDAIDQPWANLKALLPEKVTRNDILAKLLIELDQALSQYIKTGFSSFAKDWSGLSAFYQQQVTIESGVGKIDGIEVGVEPNGALKLDTGSGVHIFHSGEVSVRQRV